MRLSVRLLLIAWHWVPMFVDFLKEVEVPAIYDLSFGHMAEKLSIPIGGYARLDASDKEIVFSGWEI